MKYHNIVIRRLFILKLILLLFIAANYSYAQDIKSKIDEYLKRYVEMECFSGSVLVVKHDSIIFNNAYGMENYELKVPNTPHTVYNIASLTKPITATLIMQLVEKGKIKLDSTISDYLPDYQSKSGKKITIHQLLTHTSGIPQYESVPDFYTKLCKEPYTHKEFVKLIEGLKLVFEPGTHFKYSSFGYFLLGTIIEKVGGSSYEKQLREQILQKAGMKNTQPDDDRTLVKNRASGYDYDHEGLLNAHFRDMSTAFGTGDLLSTTEDLYLFCKALDNNKLLSDSTKDLMFTKYEPGAAYGWFISERDNNAENIKIKYAFHTGGTNGFRSIMSKSDDGTIIVILSNFSFIQRERLENDIYAIVNGGNYKIQKIKKQIKVEGKVLNNYLGTYLTDSDKSVKIYGSKNGLYFENTDSSKIIIIPYTDKNFYNKEKDAELFFDTKDKNDEIIMSYFENEELKYTATKVKPTK